MGMAKQHYLQDQSKQLVALMGVRVAVIALGFPKAVPRQLQMSPLSLLHLSIMCLPKLCAIFPKLFFLILT